MADQNPPSPPYDREASDDVDRARVVDTLVEIHKMLAIIDEGRAELLPGELQEPFHDAWVSGSYKLHALTAAAARWRRVPGPAGPSGIPVDLEAHGFTGPEGWLKRVAWTVRNNRFLGLFKTAPRTPEQLDAARQEGALAADLAGLIVGSVSEHPVAKAVGELIGVAKNALNLGRGGS